MKDDITIDLKDLLYRILLKWRLMLIFAVIFSIAANLFGVYKAKKEADAVNADQATLDLEAETLKAALTGKEAAEAETAVKSYILFRDKCLDLDDYFDNSIYASLDFRAVPTVRVSYEVDSHYEAEYPVIEKKNYDPDLADAYIRLLGNGYDETASKYGVKTEYIDELIGFEKGEKSSLFTVIIRGKDEQMCEDIAAAVDGRVNSVYPEIAAATVEHEVKKVFHDYNLRTDMSVRTTQASYTYDLNSYRSNMMSVPNNLSADQKSYYDAAIRALQEEDMTQTLTEEAPGATVSYVHKKLILAGFLLGIMLVCGVVCVLYVYHPVVRVSENITGGFERPVLGTVWESEKDRKTNPVDKWLTSMFYGRECEFEYDKRLDMLSAGIAIAMSKEGLESLYITGAGKKGGKLVKDLVKRLSKEVNVSSGESIIYSPKSYEEMAGKQAVVFVETAGDSRYDEISKEIELADQSKVKIMGFILIQR